VQQHPRVCFGEVRCTLYFQLSLPYCCRTLMDSTKEHTSLFGGSARQCLMPYRLSSSWSWLPRSSKTCMCPCLCRHFVNRSRLPVERAIPAHLLQNAAGYAILSVLKVGMGWSAAVGTGLVVARMEDGSWSPPSAIGLSSFGWGFQAGGELADLLLVLSDVETVQV
jgi:hypothetical protein